MNEPTYEELIGPEAVADEDLEAGIKLQAHDLFLRLQGTFSPPAYITLEEVRDATGFDHRNRIKFGARHDTFQAILLSHVHSPRWRQFAFFYDALVRNNQRPIVAIAHDALSFFRLSQFLEPIGTRYFHLKAVDSFAS
jgi:hypothetical protein